MLKTQRVIVLTGDEEAVRTAGEVVKGFKAVTVVTSINQNVVSTIFSHNKNVVLLSPMYDLELAKYVPVVLNVGFNERNLELLQLNVNNIMEDFPKVLKSLDIDSGDHISKNFAKKSKEKNECFLCKIAQGNPKNPEHILYESDNFFVIPGLGAFFDGYVMIVPKRHIMSYAELTEQEFEEFLQVLSDMKMILKAIYQKDIFVFECGSGRNWTEKNATSIVHAHIHLAPTDMPVLQEVRKSGVSPALIDPRDLYKYGDYPYLLYVDQQNNWFIVSDPDTYLPRQHPRRVLANYMNLGEDEYDWHTNPLRERLDIIADEIYGFLRKNFEKLPKWIQKSVEKYL